MKTLALLLVAAMVATSCNSQKKSDAETTENQEVVAATADMKFKSFGEAIQPNDAIDKMALAETYKNLKAGDTVAVKFKSEVKAVCQNKGCWMRMDVGEDEAMVKFKDYGFFMPMDIAGEEVIVEGMAFVEEVSVEEQRHYAEDAGKTAEEVAQITEPKRTLSFVSSGVLIPEKE